MNQGPIERDAVIVCHLAKRLLAYLLICIIDLIGSDKESAISIKRPVSMANGG